MGHLIASGLLEAASFASKRYILADWVEPVRESCVDLAGLASCLPNADRSVRHSCPMSVLYTKNGVPLKVSGTAVFNPRGTNFGHVRGDRVYGLDGRYRGTIVGDRLVYRSTHSASISSSRAASVGSASAQASRAGSAVWGDEPNIEP